MHTVVKEQLHIKESYIDYKKKKNMYNSLHPMAGKN